MVDFVVSCVIMLLGGDDMLDRKGVAELLKVHVNTVDNLVKKGMPSYKIGKSRRFDKDEIINWVKEEKH